MPRLAHLTLLVAGLASGCGNQGIGHDTTRTSRPVSSPADFGPGVRVSSATAATLGAAEACTDEEGATGDRWCGFVTLSPAGRRNLYVVNVSEVIAGTEVSCDAPDPNCLLLTDSLSGSVADWHPTFFEGDTLVYYDGSLVPHAWRPGMESGRVLAYPSDQLDIVFCTPAPWGAGVACVGLPGEQPDPTLLFADLYAGTADADNDPLLAPIDSVIAANQADRGLDRFSYGFPAPGYVAWTSRPTFDGHETLKLAPVEDPASTLTVASDVHAWDVSPDGSRWYWLRAIDEFGIGVLQTAAFPDGAYPSDVLANVADYGLHRDGSPVARTYGAEVVSIADPLGAPEAQVLIDQGVQTLVALSDHGYIAYAKHFVGTNVVDLFVSHLDGTAPCMLDTTVAVPLSSVRFSTGAPSALWALAKSGRYDGFHTRLGDCTTVSLAENVMVLNWIGRRTVLLMDDYDAETASGSLRYRSVGPDASVDSRPPALIAEHVDTYATAGATLVYTVNAGDSGDGVYVRSFAR